MTSDLDIIFARAKGKYQKSMDNMFFNNKEFNTTEKIKDDIIILDKLHYENWVQVIYSSKIVITPECGCVHLASLCKNQLTVIYDPDNLPKAIMHEYAPWKVSYNKLIFDDRKLNQKIMSFIQ